jgi:hypothetical protein
MLPLYILVSTVFVMRCEIKDFGLELSVVYIQNIKQVENSLNTQYETVLTPQKLQSDPKHQLQLQCNRRAVCRYWSTGERDHDTRTRHTSQPITTSGLHGMN